MLSALPLPTWHGLADTITWNYQKLIDISNKKKENKKITRALIRIVDGEESALFYAYHDGYPEGLGTSLLGYLGERFNYRDWSYKQILADIENDKIRDYHMAETEEDFRGIVYA